MKNLGAFHGVKIPRLLKLLPVKLSKEEVSAMACIFFTSRWNLSTSLGKVFADMNLYKFLLSHQITVHFYLTLGGTQLDKKIVPSSQSSQGCFILKM